MENKIKVGEDLYKKCTKCGILRNVTILEKDCPVCCMIKEKEDSVVRKLQIAERKRQKVVQLTNNKPKLK